MYFSMDCHKLLVRLWSASKCAINVQRGGFIQSSQTFTSAENGCSPIIVLKYWALTFNSDMLCYGGEEIHSDERLCKQLLVLFLFRIFICTKLLPAVVETASDWLFLYTLPQTALLQ